MRYRSQTMLAAMALCSGVASAQSSVAVYGSVDGGVSYVDNQRGKGSTRVDSGNRSPDRLGFRGTEDLGNGLKAVFGMETGFNLDDGTLKKPTVLFNRNAFVGLSSAAGTVTLGHLPDFMYEYLRFQSSGILGSAYFFHPGNLDNQANQFQIDNAIKVESAAIGGFTFGAMNGFGEQPGSTNKLRSYSLGGKYAGGGLNANLAYTVSHDRAINLGGTLAVARVLGQTLTANPIADNAVFANFNAALTTSVGASGSYKIGRFMPHAMATRIKLENTAGSVAQTNYEIGTDFDVSGNNTLGVSTARSTFDTIRWNQFNIIDMLRLSKRTTVYAALAYQRANGGYAVINSLLPSDGRKQTVSRVGLHHLF
jgi:predicted porin